MLEIELCKGARLEPFRLRWHLEVLLANGTVVTCSRELHPELFLAIPHSYGTLGYVRASGWKDVGIAKKS